MNVLTIRNINPDLDRVLREKAKREGKSLNSLVLETLSEKLLPKKNRPAVHHDLDHLAGTWSEKEEREFMESIAPFETIDRELWK